MKKLVVIVILSIIFTIISLTSIKTKIPEIKLTEDTKLSLVYNDPTTNFIGQIDFIERNQINNIKYGTEEEVLDQNVVGLHQLSKNLDINPNNIILSAHNKEGLFNIITYLRLGEKVKINSLTNSYIYQVTNIEKVNKDELMEFNVQNMRTVTLITCIENNEKRLVVTLNELT